MSISTWTRTRLRPGTKINCLLQVTADAIEYDTDGGMFRSFYGSAKDIDGAESGSGWSVFPNGVPTGTTTPTSRSTMIPISISISSSCESRADSGYPEFKRLPANGEPFIQDGSLSGFRRYRQIVIAVS
jgi:hypothetical protein